MNYEKTMKHILFFIVLSISHFSFSMNLTALIKDKTGTVGISTNTNTVKQLELLSSAFAQNHKKKLPLGYEITTSLSKEQLNFLLQVLKNKDNLFNAVTNGLISLAVITRNDVNNLGLIEEIKKVFDNLIILQTQKDNLSLAVQKKILYLFSTFADFEKEFEHAWTIPIPGLEQPVLSALFNIVQTIQHPPQSQSIPYSEWVNLKNALKQNISQLNLTQTQLHVLLSAAHFAGAKSYILAAFYEIYKENFTEDDWHMEEINHPFLKNIAKIIITTFNASIETLLSGPLSEFFTIQESSNTDRGKFSVGIINSYLITNLKGIHLIPNIQKCTAIVIENTSIIAVEPDLFTQLKSLYYLIFNSNKELKELRANSFIIPQLEKLEFNNNNIQELFADVFKLPNLKELDFDNNNLEIIHNRWAFNLPKLSILILDEPELKKVEPGWLDGLLNLKRISISPAIDDMVENQIKQTIGNSIFIKPSIFYT